MANFHFPLSQMPPLLSGQQFGLCFYSVLPSSQTIMTTIPATLKTNRQIFLYFNGDCSGQLELKKINSENQLEMLDLHYVNVIVKFIDEWISRYFNKHSLSRGNVMLANPQINVSIIKDLKSDVHSPSFYLFHLLSTYGHTYQKDLAAADLQRSPLVGK